MYIPKAFKLNKFKDVHIPDAKNLLSRYGFNSMPEGAYSGEESAPMPTTKIDTLAFMAERDRMMENEADF